MERLEHRLTDIEKRLNYYGQIPVISIVSGSLRILLGLIQTVASAAFLAIARFMQRVVESNEVKWEKVRNDSMLHLKHGGANLLRGMIEVIPFGGNVLHRYYDKVQRLEYPAYYSPV